MTRRFVTAPRPAFTASLAVALSLTIVAIGCGETTPRRVDRMQQGGEVGLFTRVRFAVPPAEGEPASAARTVDAVVRATMADDEVFLYLQQHMPQILQQSIRWDGPRANFEIVIHESHEALEKAVNRLGYPWLRAWTRYDVIHIQSPRTWGLPEWREPFRELMLHELFHLVMYQAVGTPSNWTTRVLPLWYREGMASSASGQSYRRMDLEAVRNYYVSGAGPDPLVQGEQMFRDQKDVAYGIAHRAFDFLLLVGGTRAIPALHAAMRDGADFNAAMQRATGLTEAQFRERFMKYLQEREWEHSPIPSGK